jgi:hypothetical protein
MEMKKERKKEKKKKKEEKNYVSNLQESTNALRS